MKTLSKTNAVESLPDTLTIQVSSIPNSGLGVFSLSIFEAGSIFGPMEGEELTAEQNQKQSDSSFIWEVCFIFCYLIFSKMIGAFIDRIWPLLTRDPFSLGFSILFFEELFFCYYITEKSDSLIFITRFL